MNKTIKGWRLAFIVGLIFILLTVYSHSYKPLISGKENDAQIRMKSDSIEISAQKFEQKGYLLAGKKLEKEERTLHKNLVNDNRIDQTKSKNLSQTVVNIPKLSTSKQVPVNSVAQGINFAGPAVSGDEFKGEIIRPLPKVKSTSLPLLGVDTTEQQCLKWAVLSTIFGVQEALRHLVSLQEWCIVIVADLKSMERSKFMESLKDYKIVLPFVYLTIQDQEKLFPALAEVLPVNNYGRKNIGYLFAMNHGAREIWDFDDDNIGVIPVRNFTFVKPCDGFNSKYLNPYPYFGTTESFMWPRGFPLRQIRNVSTIPKLCQNSDKINVAMVQSLAKHEPDVDGIFRLTRTTPCNFTKKINEVNFLAIPFGTYSPLNAQASLWFPYSFSTMLLPVTVSGRVADIWRGYIVEYFLYLSKKAQIAFGPPYIIQNRTVHDYLKDFNAEMNLYQQGQQLIDFLSTHGASKTIAQLFGELYQRGYLQEADVILADRWYQTVKAICQNKKMPFCETP